MNWDVAHVAAVPLLRATPVLGNSCRDRTGDPLFRGAL